MNIIKSSRFVLSQKVLIAIFLSISLSHANEFPSLIQFRNEFIKLAQHAEKCAVNITAAMNPGEKSEAGPYIQMVNSAAGLVFDQQHVLVKHKVVNGSDDITVKFHDNTIQKGRIVGVDYDYGLALIKVDDDIDSSLHPRVSDTPLNVEPGEPVLLLSNSLDVMPAVTFGIVNCNRSDGMIQVSAEIPAGTGGASVFDFNGCLVGIVAAEIDFFTDELPYSSDITSNRTVLIYPIHEIKRVAEAMLSRAVQNPVYLGILAADWPSQLGGAHVKQVIADSPAAKSGFRLGDIVLSINNHKVASAFDLFQEISTHSPGDEVKFEILRGEQIKDILVKVISPPPSSKSSHPTAYTPISTQQSTSHNINKEYLQLRLERLEKEMNKIKQMLKEH